VQPFYVAHSGAVPALTNAGPDCDPCGLAAEGIVQSKGKV
jgi:hypothetical protein